MIVTDENVMVAHPSIDIITKVDDNTPAAKAGLKQEDVIIAIEDPCTSACPPVVVLPLLAVQTGPSVTAKVSLDGVTYPAVGGTDGSGGGGSSPTHTPTSRRM